MARFKISCCQNCPDRYPGCHSHCEKYIQEKAEYDATMAEKRKEAEIRNGLNSFLYNSIEKTNKQINYRRKYRKDH